MARSLAAEEWIALYKELKSTHQDRNEDYWHLHNIYHGNYYQRRNRDDHDGAGRLILRDSRKMNTQRNPLVANLLKGIVDDYVSLVGTLPDIKVPPPGTGQPDQEFADKVERYHYGAWWASRMLMQLKGMGWWNSVMGGCAGVIWPNFDRRHAMLRFVAPYNFYGVPDLVDPFALSKAIICEKVDYMAIKDYYPNLDLSAVRGDLGERYYSYQGKKRKVEVLKCFDKDEVVTIIGEREVARARHELNTCLVVPIQNIYIPGELRGHSDIEQSVGMNEHMNFILNAYEEYVLQDIYAPLVVVNPQKAPEDIDPLNPNEVIAVHEGGSVSRLQPGNGSQLVNQEIARAQSLIEYNTGAPKVRTQGRMESAITTGRGIEQSQGPHYQRVEYRYDMLAFRLEQLNELSVHVTQSLFPKDEFTVYGQRGKRGSTFNMKMKGEDLQNYGFNKVLYSPSMHMGLTERAVFVLQLLGGEDPLIDDRTAIEFLGITDHPDEMMKRIEAMVERRLARRAALERSMTATPGTELPQEIVKNAASLEGGAAPNSAGAATVGAGAGGAAPAALPPVAGGPAEGGGMFGEMDMSQPLEAPALGEVETALGGDEVQQIQQLIASVQTTGAVYLIPGDPITVLCESYVDARKISRRLRKAFPNVSVRKAGAKIPEGAITVAAGRGGEVPVAGEV